jgi:hypothetical protein
MRERARKCFEERFEIHQASTTLLGILQQLLSTSDEALADYREIPKLRQPGS